MPYTVELITPIDRKEIEMQTDMLFGFLPASMADGCAVYAAGAVNPLTIGQSFVVAPSTEWKGWKNAKNRR